MQGLLKNATNAIAQKTVRANRSAMAGAMDSRPIKEALLFIEFLEGKCSYSPEMDCIRAFLAEYNLDPSIKKNPQTYYLRESLKAYLSCLLQRIEIGEFQNWARAGGLNDSQISFVQQVGDLWLRHWTQQRAIAPIQRTPIESSRPKETQIETVLQPRPPVEIQLDEPHDLALSDPGDMVVSTTPEGLRLVEVINRALPLESGITFKLVNVLNGVRVTEYRIAQDLSTKDKAGKPARLLPPEKIESLSSTLKVYAKTGAHPVIFPSDGCIVIQIAKDEFEPIPIEKHIGSAFTGRCDRPLQIPVGLGMNRELIGFELEGHAVIGGQTRSGKTSEQDAIAYYLMNKYPPHLLRLLMIDPQEINFACYDGLPWLLGGKVLAAKGEVANAIQYVYAEKDRRREMIQEKGLRNLLAYNQMIAKAIAEGKAKANDYLPFIVIMIDELAELKTLFDMAENPNNAEEQNGDQLMESLIQIARAFAKFGIHLIMATQRPSKEAGGAFSPHLAANTGIRIAFKTADAPNSEIILGKGYKMAAQLRGKGDGYLLSPSYEIPQRFQGFWADPDRIIRPFCDKVRGLRWEPNDSNKGWTRSGGLYPEDLSISDRESNPFPLLDDMPIVESSNDPIRAAIAQYRSEEPNISESALINKLKANGIISGTWKKCQEIVRHYQ